MAKIRAVKPEIWTDDKFVELSPLARLLFIGMWNFACDNGHLDDSSRQLKMRILPGDECNVTDLLDELLKAGMVTRCDGYVKIVRLAQHQRMDRRYLVFCDHCPHDEHPTFTPEDKATGTRRVPAVPTSSTRRAPNGDTSDESKNGTKQHQTTANRHTRRVPDEHTSCARGKCDGDGDGDGDGETLSLPSQPTAPTTKPKSKAKGERENDHAGHTPARQLAATLLNIDQDDPLLDALPAALKAHNVRSPAAWLRTAHANGDLEEILASSTEVDPWAHIPANLEPPPPGVPMPDALKKRKAYPTPTPHRPDTTR